MTPEGRVKHMVNEGLKEFRPYVFKFMPVQTGYGSPGLDYFLCAGGQFVAIETKVPGKDLTPRQIETKAAIEIAGGKVFVVKDKPSLAEALSYIRSLL